MNESYAKLALPCTKLSLYNRWSLYYSSQENEQAPVIPLWSCCSSTMRPIETGVIFVNSFMWVLTHMPNQGAQPCNQGAVEFPLVSLVLILRRLLLTFTDGRKISRLISSKLHGGVDEHSEASTRRGTRATSAEVVRSYQAGGRPSCDQERFGKNQLWLPGVCNVPAGGESQ